MVLLNVSLMCADMFEIVCKPYSPLLLPESSVLYRRGGGGDELYNDNAVG